MNQRPFNTQILQLAAINIQYSNRQLQFWMLDKEGSVFLCSHTRVDCPGRLQNSFWTLPNPKNNPLEPQKVKKWPQTYAKIKSENWRKHRK